MLLDDDADEFPEGHDVVVSKGPCPKCGSSDANVTYADGHEHCFSAGCGYFKKAGAPDKPASAARPHGGGGGELLREEAITYGDLKARGISSATAKRFGIGTSHYNKSSVHVYPYYDIELRGVVAQKLRFPNKDFVVLKGEGYPKNLNKAALFGRHVFGDKFDRTVVITEGELDAASVAQAVDFKIACVSINTGADGAAASIKANYLWLDRFEDVVLFLDDDEPGRLAAEEAANLFKVGKVRIARMPGYKDPSAALQAGRPGDITTAVYAATAWRPRGIVNAAANPSDVMARRTKQQAYRYPDFLPVLQDMTGGIVLGEVIYHVAGTGVGKSTVLREIQYGLIQQGAKIAVLSFEDTVRDAKMGLMSVAASERLLLVPEPDPETATEEEFKAYDEKMLKVHASVFGGGKVELFDAETAEWTMKAILGYIRYCAKALDCEVIFIDPLSFVAAGIELTADERRVLDMVAGELAKLAKELGINLQISHHLKRTVGVPHEEGAPTSLNELRSSGGLANFAMCVIGWERNNQAEGDAWRIMRARVIKAARRVGRTGLADTIYFNDNGRYTMSLAEFPPMGKPKGEGEGGGKHFEPAGEF